MRLTRIFRRALGPAVVAATAVLCAAAPAQADVALSPTTAVQGGGVNLTFKLVNDNPRAKLTKVKLTMPAASPVAEVYPLSVPDWAPLLTNRPVNPPMPNVHGPDPITQTTGTILWTAMPGREVAPGKSSIVMMTMGPLPVGTEQMTFELEPTYADGKPGPALSNVVLTLTPAPPEADEAAPDGDTETVADGSGGGLADLGWWIAGLLVAAVAVLFWLRSRRGDDDSDDEDDTEPDPADRPAAAAEAAPAEAEPAGAAAGPSRAKVSAWSYRDRS